MVKRLINAIRGRKNETGISKIPRSMRILLPVCIRPGHGHQILLPPEGEHFLVEFDGATKVTARNVLKKMFPHLSHSDVHVYPEFSTDGQRYQPAVFDWPLLPEMVHWDQFEALGWMFVPIGEHPEAKKLKAKINYQDPVPAAPRVPEVA